MGLIDAPRSHRRLWLLAVAVVVAATVMAVLGQGVGADSADVNGTGLGGVGGSSPVGSGSVPAFYATISTTRIAALPRVQVHRSSDGAVTGTRLSPPGWRVREVSAAADDRTCLVAETGLGSCPGDRFFRFSVTGTGALFGLHQVAARADGLVEALAVSPDGTRVAFVSVCTTPIPSGSCVSLT
jgi:hypothetical protein